ncbi:hypothetical protein [Methanoregula sp.]|uniref:hypothetical protein n=1 Tax=Methanoregula sp. TaxID=2052170 RepID=UPI0035684C69
MFSKAYEIASQYTAPVIISSLSINNEVQCHGGAFVYLNNEGWILSVAHIFNTRNKCEKDSKLLTKYYQEIKNIENNPRINLHTKKKKIANVKKDPDWVITDSYFWGNDNVYLEDIKIIPEADLVIGRLDPFHPKSVKTYPKLKDPSELKPGTSLCKLGFPFHQINAVYDNKTGGFQFDQNAFPVPLFPIDGILTRIFLCGKTKDEKYDIKFIETSSPGLLGQSGGPIFDSNATIWGIQSHTSCLPLGFSPKIAKNGKDIEENQFINVGYGIHPEVIINLLTDNGVKFELG